jgi:hypothetical protein
MEAASFSKILVSIYQTSRPHIPADRNFDTCRHENLKFIQQIRTNKMLLSFSNQTVATCCIFYNSRVTLMGKGKVVLVLN